MTVTMPPTKPVIDAQPFLKRNVSNIWVKVEQACEEVYQAFKKACEEEGISALVVRSNAYEHPTKVVIECWLPPTLGFGARSPDEEHSVTERFSMEVTIEPKPYFTYEIEYGIVISDRGKAKGFQRLWQFPDSLAREFVRFLLRRDRKPNVSSYMLRYFWFDIFKPRNKVKAVKTDVLVIVNLVLVVLGFFTMGIAWIAAIVIYIYMLKRELTVRNPGKPLSEPRQLLRVDSWQTVIFGLGSEVELIKGQFMQALSSSKSTQEFDHAEEHIIHRSLDGIEEREQIVLSSGRGIVFCHIYQYGDDLYAGWVGHLNVSQWIEQVVARGFDRETNRPVQINTTVPGYQVVSEYDVIDLSTLMEWTHAQYVKILKRLIEERHIDQEIDFQVTRGDRQGLTKEDVKTEDDIQSRVKSVMDIFKRKS